MNDRIPGSLKRGLFQAGLLLPGIGPRYCLCLLVGLWLAGMGLLGVLQLLRTGLGFKVWPMGEDRVWLYFLQNTSGTRLAKMFWSTACDRNPLSPYWYLAAKPLILGSSAGFYLVRHLVSLLCGLSAFALVNRLGRNRQTQFAFACGLLTLLWNFSAYRELMLWMMLGDLAVSLLSLWAYCCYIDSDRRQGGYLALSLLLYLFAISTYTLQASSCLAVFPLALWRGTAGPGGLRGWAGRLVRSAVDVGFYLGVFVVFLLIWVTVARPTSDYYAMSPSLFAKQFLDSLRQGAWHPSYTSFLRDVRANWNGLVLGAVWLAACALFAVLLRKSARREGADPGGPRGPAGGGLAATVGYTLLVTGAIALGTLLLESTSTIWYPGSRWLMLQQVFQPLLYCGVIFGAAALCRRLAPLLGSALRTWGMAALCAAAFVVGLEYNRQLNARTAAQRHFLDCVRMCLPRVQTPTNLIVELDGVDFPEIGHVAHRYVQTYYHSPQVNLQFLRRGPALDRWAGYNTMAFGPDDVGVMLMKGDESVAWVPYSEVLFLRYDGHRATPVEEVSKKDLEGYRVAFQRQGPIRCRYAGSVIGARQAALRGAR